MTSDEGSIYERMAPLWKNPIKKPAVNLVYLQLWAQRNAEGEVTTSLAAVGQIMNKGRGEAKGWIAELEKMGLIKVLAKVPMLRIYVFDPETLRKNGPKE